MANTVMQKGTDDLSNKARLLVKRAVDCFDPKYGFSTASCAVYDTAWVSMISKSTGGHKQWLFPESFHYLLRSQRSWGIDSVSQTVGILDTAAGLLALLKHASEPLQIQDYSAEELWGRIALASKSLGTQLAAWKDVETTNHIGVELIVPALLQYLKDEDARLSFSFPSEKLLLEMHAAKMARFRTDVLYDTVASPASHSPEAFIGKIDFDRVTHQLRYGAMWGSTSSTAVYLMHATIWHAEAEDWLRHAIAAGQGHGDGGITGVFPTDFFELNWVVATLLQSGFLLSDLDSTHLNRMAGIVKDGFEKEGGVIGHGPGCFDVDDTAKGLLALKLLGREDGTTPDVMIRMFEKKDAFGTFASERDRSISSNCHVLLALLAWEDYSRYGSQIRKAANFMCEYWWNCNGHFKDKWNLSHLYPTMLLVKGFTLLLRDVDAGLASELVGRELSIKISIALFQACVRTLREQGADGSWEDSPELTSYAILVLAEARNLSFFGDLVPRLQEAIDTGVAYLETCSTKPPDQYWTSKTRYSVKFVMEAYILSARRIGTALQRREVVGHSLDLEASILKTQPFLPLLKLTKHFSTVADQDIQTSLTEAALFLPLLRARRLEVFPRDKLRVSQDAYFDMLPFLWVGCSNRSKNFVPTSFVLDMLFMTLINIQMDEFMESVATQAFEHDPDTLHRLIDEATDEAWNGVDSHLGSNGQAIGCEADFKSEHANVYGPLLRFSKYILNHDPILGANLEDRKSLKREFLQFLHTQTTQMSDNVRFRAQQENRGRTFATDLPYFDWVRTIASHHVSTPLIFAWVCCWTSGILNKGAETFGEPTEKYLATALSRHLATTNRMFNDLGSIERDTAECNLNSLHFPEFSRTGSQKPALKWLAEHEHGCVEYTLKCLQQKLKRAYPHQPANWAERMKLGPIRLLCDVSHLWDQLYLIRDHSSTMKADGST